MTQVRRKTFAATILAASMVGVQEALEGPKEEPVVIDADSGAGNDDDLLALDLDPYDPAASVAVVRPDRQPASGATSAERRNESSSARRRTSDRNVGS